MRFCVCRVYLFVYICLRAGGDGAQACMCISVCAPLQCDERTQGPLFPKVFQSSVRMHICTHYSLSFLSPPSLLISLSFYSVSYISSMKPWHSQHSETSSTKAMLVARVSACMNGLLTFTMASAKRLCMTPNSSKVRARGYLMMWCLCCFFLLVPLPPVPASTYPGRYTLEAPPVFSISLAAFPVF